jgi:hypothetical protein
MDYTPLLNTIINKLDAIEGFLENYLYDFTHFLIAFMIIQVIAILVGVAFIIFWYKFFGVD